MKWQSCYLFSCLLVTAGFALPSRPSRPGGEPLQATFRAESFSEDSYLGWELPPNPNSTHHLIFNSVSGLLQRWPNTLRRNGHSILPATIPTGTILYHGRTDDQVPDVPEWVAFDFDHAYLFCYQPCYVISLQAKRDLRLVYFDGSSAAKMQDGPMDSQDVIAWGKPRPDKFLSERERIEILCNWGKPLGLDGFVRMEFHFEVMLCDILDGLEIVTFFDVLPKNTTHPLRRPLANPLDPSSPPPWPTLPPTVPPPGWRGSLPSDAVSFFEANVAGSWHDSAPGETRVRLDYAGLVTFYDEALSSLIDARQEMTRLHHRLKGISTEDAERVRTELETVLTRKKGRSAVDWASIVRVVTERYAGRLEHLCFLLSSNSTFLDAVEQAAAARTQLLVALAPYITTMDVPQELPGSANVSWAAPVVRRCATTQTSHISLGPLTPQDARIHAAVENTLHEICRRLVLVWLEFFDVEGADEARAAGAIELGRRHIDELIGWLDWSSWVRCEPGCNTGEICYLPSWPFLMKGDDPYDMTPRCISPENLI
ncbi:hypothetical protein B0F90DRAFT_1631770 [Multifurca ochricompacta]|uniref:Uncharacterized protein n=1 Tax=Multifurca ochricompacta TaxID=376703 RepID=A0AAD4QMP7_9AGAM|nr:hypothetical protein B0F90DRAFT_1631770 [Multifurca ochricompacta]